MFVVIHCPEFYIQCERIFRPELNGQAVIVVSEYSNARVIASSIEAQDLGLFPGQHGDQLKEALATLATSHTVTTCRPNHELYADLSSRFIKSVELLAPKVSSCANDEVLLELNSPEASSNLASYTHKVAYTLEQWLGISVLIGIAATPTLAKLACYSPIFLKQHQIKQHYRVVDLSDPIKRNDLLEKTLVEDINGISKKVANKLSEIQVHTALELSKTPTSQIKHLNSVIIERIAIELAGLPCQKLSANIQKQKNNSVFSNSLELHTLGQAKNILKKQIANAAEQLKSTNSSCQKVTISLSTTPIDQQQHIPSALTADLPKPSDTAATIVQLANQLLDSLWYESRQYHSLKLTLEDISPTLSDQFGLFACDNEHRPTSYKAESPKLINIETALLASTFIKNNHGLLNRRSLLSPSFTTKWSDIPRVS